MTVSDGDKASITNILFQRIRFMEDIGGIVREKLKKVKTAQFTEKDSVNRKHRLKA